MVLLNGQLDGNSQPDGLQDLELMMDEFSQCFVSSPSS